ncbi:MAG: sulfotransferase domain-containing protein [Pseudomonadota bacterium]
MLQVSDSVKKWAVLVPTAVLPKPWRVAARREGLARVEVGKALRTDLLIIGHPKSGNTWLRVMMSRLYQVRHGIPASVIVTSDELARRNPEIPRISATNGYYSYEGAVGDLLAPDAPDTALRHKPIVFLARNPCDIAVSWFFQFTKRQSAHKQELINAFIEHPIDRRTIGMWDFVRHSDIGLPFLIDYLNRWQRTISTLERGVMVRYEDLRGEPFRTLRQITEIMGETFSDGEIEEAVKFGSFDNLRELETKGFFRQGGLTLRNPNDPESFKVRRAKVGGYRDYFSPEQVAELEGLMAEKLLPVFGYTTSQDEAEPIAAQA